MTEQDRNIEIAEDTGQIPESREEGQGGTANPEGGGQEGGGNPEGAGQEGSGNLEGAGREGSGNSDGPVRKAAEAQKGQTDRTVWRILNPFWMSALCGPSEKWDLTS